MINALIFVASAFYRPAMSWWLIAAVMLVAVAFGVATVRRERLWWPLVLRVVAITSLGWVLLGYSHSRQGDADRSLPTLTLLVDTSISMSEKDATRTPDSPAVSRLEAVTQAYLHDEMLQRLRGVAEVNVRTFDEQLRSAEPSDLKPVGRATALIRALSQLTSDATVILSDGHDNSASRGITDNVQAAGRLFAVPVGAPRSAPDLSLQAWPESDRLFDDQSTTITASIMHSGLAGRQAIIELLHDGEVIEQQTQTLGPRSAELRFSVTPPLLAGQPVQTHHYRARTRLLDGEETFIDNNTQDLFIQTSRGQIKVLLLEGEPYWDTRSLARLITSHPRFDLTALYAFGDERRSSLIGETIARQLDPVMHLGQFDIIILGRQVQRLVDPAFSQRLSDFVRSGGAVVFARGQPFTATDESGARLLAEIDPISPVNWAEPVLGEMRVRLGQSSGERGPLAGLQDGEVLSRLPGMIAATRIDGRKTASLVLLEQQSKEGPAMAAMTSLRVGSGISLAVLTEGLWRWELLPGTDEQDAQVQSIYGVLWVRALQWLASGGDFLPGQDIAIQADRMTTQPGDPVNLRISTRYVETDNLPLAITLTHDDNTERLIPTRGDSAGIYSAAFTPQQTGVYTISVTTPGRSDLIDPAQPLTTRLVVIDRSAERRDTSAKPELLKQLVEPTGGQCMALGEVEPVIAYMQTLQALRGSVQTPAYAFNQWPVFALIAGCFGLEWVLRRRMGLR